jgi:ABC-type multidrug transport system ATPase subunit
MINANRLSKSYGDHVVLRELGLQVDRGERVAILGLNGAGKTTLFRCLLGLTGFEGDLQVGGHLAGPHGREARRLIGYVPQQPPRFDLTLDGFIELFSALRGGSAPDVRKRMLQKAVLGIALGAEAPVLLLDEPTANLDAGSRREFLAALGRIDPATTLLFASHRLSDVEALADRLLVLSEGRFVYDGRPGQLWRLAGGIELRLMVPSDHVEALARMLESRSGVRFVRANGTGVLVRVEDGRELDLLLAVREAGIPLLDFRTHPPALEEVMAHLSEAE